MSVKIQPETIINKRKRKKKSYIRRKRKKHKIRKKPSLFERLHEKYKKRKWLVRTVFVTKCTFSIVLIILEFVL